MLDLLRLGQSICSTDSRVSWMQINSSAANHSLRQKEKRERRKWLARGSSKFEDASCGLWTPSWPCHSTHKDEWLMDGLGSCSSPQQSEWLKQSCLHVHVSMCSLVRQNLDHMSHKRPCELQASVNAAVTLL